MHPQAIKKIALKLQGFDQYQKDSTQKIWAGTHIGNNEHWCLLIVDDQHEASRLCLRQIFRGLRTELSPATQTQIEDAISIRSCTIFCFANPEDIISTYSADITIADDQLPMASAIIGQAGSRLIFLPTVKQIHTSTMLKKLLWQFFLR